MPMPLPTNTIAVGDFAYLIQSPARGVTDCLIVAHGGAVGGERFIVPPGKQIRFLVEGGVVNEAKDGRHVLRKYAKKMHRNGSLTTRDYASGRSCGDYVLGKALGNHFGNTNVTYQDIRDELDRIYLAQPVPGVGIHWVPHYVTVRNRNAQQYIWLSRLIKDLIAADGTIQSIYCANCRSPADVSFGTKAGKRAFVDNG